MIDLTKLVTREQQTVIAAASVITSARTLRGPIMGILDGMQASALSKGDAARATAIEAAKQGLRDITKADLSASKGKAEMQGVVMAQYKAIAAALPADIRIAFAASIA